MRVFWAWFFFALAISGCSYGEVVTLSGATIDRFITENGVVMIKYFDPACGYCQQMEKAYEQVAKSMEGLAFFAELDVMKNRDVAVRVGIKGTPTLMLYENGQFKQAYKGNRERDDILDFMVHNMDLKARVLETEAEVESFIKSSKAMRVIMVKSVESKAQGTFDELVEEVHAFNPLAVRFATVEKTETLKQFVDDDITEGDVVLFPPMDARKNIEAIVAGGLGKYQRVLRKIKRASVPLMVDMSTKLKNVFTQLGENVVVVFAPGGKVDRKYKEALINSAIIARDQYDMYFAICNSKKEKTFLSYMGLSNEIPAIGIYNFETKAKYKFPTKKIGITEDHLVNFIKEVGAGKLKPYIKSQPIPHGRTSSNPIQKVVGDTFNEFVSDSTRDRLLAIHIAGDQWDADREKIEPIAKEFYDVESFIVGEVEVPANDLPGDWSLTGDTKLWILPGKLGGRVQLMAELETGAVRQFLSEHTTLEVRSRAAVPDPGTYDRVVPRPADAAGIKQDL